jgi:hypothetical protein
LRRDKGTLKGHKSLVESSGSSSSGPGTGKLVEDKIGLTVVFAIPVNLFNQLEAL